MPGLPVLSVSECVRQLNELLKTQPICVEGEVQSFSVSQGRWVFFTLKDAGDGSILECFMPAFRLRLSLADGMVVRVVSTPSLHAKSGRFRLVVEHVEIVGAGGLRQAFEQLRKKLEQDGLFAPDRKRALPRYPERIGLIASPDSAAYSDFIKVLNARFGGIEVIVAPCLVQGEKAAASVQEALRHLEFESPPVDLIVMTRGGGSFEDLMAFNDEALARAMYRFPVPIVTAIGHERDVTIADLVADVRASTPSNAAELISFHRREVEAHLNTLLATLEQKLTEGIATIAHDVDRYGQLFASALERETADVSHVSDLFLSASQRFFTRLETERAQLRAWPSRTEKVLRSVIERSRERVKAQESLFSSYDPKRVLKRGYSIVRRGGRVVQSFRDVTVGAPVSIEIRDGALEAEVTEIINPVS